jgi:ceramide glucosyltransferase
MHSILTVCEVALGLCIVIGSACWAVVAALAFFFRKREFLSPEPFRTLPPVTLIKPVYGLEKNLRANLETACTQDYPDYQVLYSVQRADDPAIPLLRALQDEFGPERVTVVIANVEVGVNGKINNLAGALPHARHEIVVMSDSDVRLRPDFLRAVVSPLADPKVGAVSTFFKARDAGTWYEHMEQLTINIDQFAMAMLASATSLVDFCFGASIAMSKRSLAAIGGLEALADYLVEDNELGRRVASSGKKVVTIPYVVETTIDLRSPAHWWQKQTYWDQNSRVAVPGVFVASLALRTIPLSLVFAALRGFDSTGFSILALAVGARMTAVVAVLVVALGERAGLRSIWLVPIKDVLSLVWFAQAFIKPTVVWRGVEMALTQDGRLTAITHKTSAPRERAS